MMSGDITTAPMLSVFDGRVCVGFILARGKTGFEAYDANDKSLGVFANSKDAAAAIMALP